MWPWFKQKIAFFKQHGEHVATAFFVLGFVWDNLTLTRIDFWFDQLVLLTHLAIVVASIVLMQLIESGRVRHRHVTSYASWLPNVAQFSLGALFSGYFVFYFRSAALSASWPFILILAALLTGNEFLRERYQRFALQVAMFFLVLFSFLIFQLPILFGFMSPYLFVLAGVASLAGITGMLFLINTFSETRLRESVRVIVRAVGAIYVMMNLLYFTNLIPPVPLSMKTLEVVHRVERTTVGDYEIQYEPAPRYVFWRKSDPVYHQVAGEPVMIFASVFAPTDLNTSVYHHFERYDDGKDSWVTLSRIDYPISGGQGKGYRGYTESLNVTPGRWRVSVETARGQVIGRIGFRVIAAEAPPALRLETK